MFFLQLRCRLFVLWEIFGLVFMNLWECICICVCICIRICMCWALLWFVGRGTRRFLRHAHEIDTFHVDMCWIWTQLLWLFFFMLLLFLTICFANLQALEFSVCVFTGLFFCSPPKSGNNWLDYINCISISQLKTNFDESVFIYLFWFFFRALSIKRNAQKVENTTTTISNNKHHHVVVVVENHRMFRSKVSIRTRSGIRSLLIWVFGLFFFCFVFYHKMKSNKLS